MRAALVRAIPRAARHAPHWEAAPIGNIFDDLGDDISDAANAVADVATSVGDWVGQAAKDAAGVIGGVLHVVAPIIGLIPGFGTAIAIAVSAASALALGEDLPDALLDTASAAIPGGIPRIAFDGATHVTKDLVAGKNVIDSVVLTCHNAAMQAGGARAAAVFDSVVATIRSGNVPDSLLDAGRAQLAASGTTEMLAAYDAGVAVAKGESASQVCLAAGRDYVQASGGAVALAAFDAGYALAAGQSLQEAGFAALKVFVAGNDSAEQAVRFIELLAEAQANGTDIYPVLIQELKTDLAPLLGNLQVAQFLDPYLRAAENDLANFQAWVPSELATAWGCGEPIIRAAQAVLRSGSRDPRTLTDLQNSTGLIRPKSFRLGGLTPAENAAYQKELAASAAALNIPPVCLQAQRALARNSPIYPDLKRQCDHLTSVSSMISNAHGQGSIARPAQLSSDPILAALGLSPKPATVPYVKPTNLTVPFPPTDALIDSSGTTIAPRNGVASDVALAGVVLLAAGALVWWVKSS